MYGIYENGRVIAKFAAPLQVKSNQPISASDTLSLKRAVNRRAAQRWEIEANIVPLAGGAQDLMVSLVTKGSAEIVQILMPQNYGAKIARRDSGSWAYAKGTKGSTQTFVTGFLNSFLPKGTFIRFANHSKVYMTTTNLTGVGENNEAALSLFPALHVDVPPNTRMFCFDDVIGSFRYDMDVIKGMVYTDGMLMDPGSLRFVEAL